MPSPVSSDSRTTTFSGPMQITVVPTRGMSIYDIKSKDIRLGWDSPVEGVVHPKYIELLTGEENVWVYYAGIETDSENEATEYV